MLDWLQKYWLEAVYIFAVYLHLICLWFISGNSGQVNKPLKWISDWWSISQNATSAKCMKSLSHIWLLVTQSYLTVAHQAPPSTGFSRWHINVFCRNTCQIPSWLCLWKWRDGWTHTLTSLVLSRTCYEYVGKEKISRRPRTRHVMLSLFQQDFSMGSL